MLQFVLRRAAVKSILQTKKIKPEMSIGFAAQSRGMAASQARLYGMVGAIESPSEKIARQMIQYALGSTRSQKSEDAYAQALMVLEQGISNLQGVDSSKDAMGMLMLAVSTLLYEREELKDAMDKLQIVQRLDNASLAVKVAACEALVGLNLESGQDVSALVLANDCFQLLANSLEGNSPTLEVLKSRVKTMKGLSHMILGELKSAEEFFGDLKEELEDREGQTRNFCLCRAEFLHATGNLSVAKDLYGKVMLVSKKESFSDDSCLASSNMISEEVLLAATCALGQLLSHSGLFGEAEELLTKALTSAESHFGPTHRKVGIILTCIAMMYKQKAKAEGSSAILVQEGLYRRAIDMLKAPALDDQDASLELGKKDVIALARGGYADVLCIQQNRKAEGERLKKWAEAAWRNRRMSLTEALELSQPSRYPIVDTRICRVL